MLRRAEHCHFSDRNQWHLRLFADTTGCCLQNNGLCRQSTACVRSGKSHSFTNIAPSSTVHTRYPVDVVSYNQRVDEMNLYLDQNLSNRTNSHAYLWRLKGFWSPDCAIKNFNSKISDLVYTSQFANINLNSDLFDTSHVFIHGHLETSITYFWHDLV